MDEIAERNRNSAERLRAIGERLSDEELARTIDQPWTAAGLFAHIAFWDRFVLERWKLAAERGDRAPMSVDDAFMERINDASLDQWMSIPPRSAVEQCLVAAAAVDAYLGGIDHEVRAEVISEGRRRLVDRSIHRGDHLGTLESAFVPSS
ncbi:MAG TPA: DinB family protein [Actinomycetota bacterium]|nr:DinB family protein [Actinomycetota bacterium]